VSLVYTFTSIPGLLLVLRVVCRCDQFGPMPPICPDHLGRIVCACVRACVRVCFTHTHTQMKSILVAQGLDVAMRSDARGCVFMSLHITRTHEIQTQTRAHACANADACTRVRVHVHAHSLTHTHKDAYTHTHTHTHTLAASAMANATMDPAAVNMAQRGGGGGRGSRGGRGGRGGASGMGSQ